MLFCHRGGVIGAKVDEPQLRTVNTGWILRLLNNLNAIAIDMVDAAVAVDVQATAEADPFLPQRRQRCVDGLAHDPAHIVLLHMAALATAPQHHQEQLLGAAHRWAGDDASAWATTARQWAMNSSPFLSPLACLVCRLRISKVAVVLLLTGETVGLRLPS